MTNIIIVLIASIGALMFGIVLRKILDKNQELKIQDHYNKLQLQIKMSAMKQQVNVCYSGSGVKFTLILSKVSLVLGILSFIVGIIIACASWDEVAIIGALVGGFVALMSFLTMSAILAAISSIAKTALYNRTLIEGKYWFKNVDSIEETQQNDFTENNK